jgi:hypothetical protein
VYSKAFPNCNRFTLSKIDASETNRAVKELILKLWKKWQTECPSGKKLKCMIQDPLIMLTTSEQKY